MTVKAFKDQFYKRLETIHPRQEIESFFRILAEEYLAMRSVEVLLNPDKEIEAQKLEELLEVQRRLVLSEPLQYILGQTEFYGLNFKLNKAVLIPRPETEELVEWIIADTNHSDDCTVLDIGTGSGCIAVSLAAHLPNAKIDALDVSHQALKLAKGNASLNKTQVHFKIQNILETESLEKQYDVIVSNPPYVRHQEKEEIHPNVLHFEPHLALFVADDDALIFYKKITELAKQALKPNGTLYVEINQYLARETQNLFIDLGFSNIELRKDFAGKPRMIKARV